MPTQVNIDDAQNQLVDLIAIASQGGEVVILENGKPLVKLVAANAAAYGSSPPGPNEFTSDEEALGWEAEGWENLA